MTMTLRLDDNDQEALWWQAAALFQSIIDNRALIDGNTHSG